MSQNLQNIAKFQKFQLENLVDFEKCCKTHILLQKSEPIQPKTSNILPKFCQPTLSDVLGKAAGRGFSPPRAQGSSRRAPHPFGAFRRASARGEMGAALLVRFHGEQRNWFHFSEFRESSSLALQYQRATGKTYNILFASILFLGYSLRLLLGILGSASSLVPSE